MKTMTERIDLVKSAFINIKEFILNIIDALIGTDLSGCLRISDDLFVSNKDIDSVYEGIAFSAYLAMESCSTGEIKRVYYFDNRRISLFVKMEGAL